MKTDIQKNISIGVSVDGPKEVNDFYRKDKNGNGTFHLTKRGIDLLNLNKIPFGTISVITNKSIEQAEELVDFLLSINSQSIGLNIEEAERYHETSSLNDQPFKIRLFVEKFCSALNAKNKLHLSREYKDVAQSLITQDFNEDVRRGENKLFSIINVSWDGMVTTFSPELAGYNSFNYGTIEFGNVHNSFQELRKNELLSRVSHDIDYGIEKCKQECDYYNFCGGGSPSNKLHENLSFNSTVTEHCKFHKMYFVDEFLKRAIND